ncbi:MAG: NADH-quinone oxidoreductase subunit C [Thermoleophilia bacterium]|nr:NADH-quinone oxidoreductase subunit C [Thermoleophilia bacterium]
MSSGRYVRPPAAGSSADKERTAAQASTSLALTVVTAAAKLRRRFGARLLEENESHGELTFVISPGDWMRVLAFCKSAPDLAFDQLDCLMGDHLPERADAPFAVLAHLTSHTHGHRLRVKTFLAEGDSLPTVTGLWPSAGFDERETWEMFGIGFQDHPDLRRLLTAEDLEGFPLRKDFPLEGTVGGRIRTDLRGKI